jgi:hypothetical protein
MGRLVRQKGSSGDIAKAVGSVKGQAAQSVTRSQDRAQVHTYLKATGYRLGLLISFGLYPKREDERFVR